MRAPTHFGATRSLAGTGARKLHRGGWKGCVKEYPNSFRTRALFAYHGLLEFRDSYYAWSRLLDHVNNFSRTGCFRTSFPGAFFTAARLGLGLATVRFVAFADFATLAALPRLAEFPLRSLARFCTFDPFFRLAMIAPFGAP